MLDLFERKAIAAGIDGLRPRSLIDLVESECIGVAAEVIHEDSLPIARREISRDALGCIDRFRPAIKNPRG
jgi:hypothetical protein